MVELSLTFALCAYGLAFVLWASRWLDARAAPGPEITRSAALVARAVRGFVRRQSAAVAVLSSIVGGALFLGYGLLRPPAAGDPRAPAVSYLESGVWLSVSFVVGAGTALAVSRAGASLAVAASARVAVAARRSFDEALRIAVRGGSVPAVFGGAAVLLGMVTLLVAFFAYHGGFSRDPAAFRLLGTAPLVLAGFPLGAGFTALVSQLSSSTFAASADLAADLAAREGQLAEDDPRNPAAVVDLAGDAVGEAAGRAACVFAAQAIETFAVLFVSLRVFAMNPSQGAVVAHVALPFVARAFGLVATTFGVMIVRTDDREEPMSAIARGLYVTSVLGATALAGVCKWLLEAAWLPLFGAALLGVAGAVAIFHLSTWLAETRHRLAREIADLSRLGPSVTVLRGLAGGASAVAPIGLVIALVVLGANGLGEATGLAHGGAFGVALAVLGLLAPSGYAASLAVFAPLVDVASGLVGFTVGGERPEIRGRTQVLDAVGNSLKAFSQQLGAASALVGLPLLVREVATRGGGRVVGLDEPVLLAAAGAGLVFVAWLSGQIVLSVVRTARRILDEARRRIRDASRRDAEPAFEGCLEIATGLSVRAMVVPGVVSALVPLVLPLGLRLAVRGDKGPSPVEVVATFLMATTAAGVLGSIALSSAGAAWDNAKRYIATGAHGGAQLVDDGGVRRENPTYVAAEVGDRVGDPMKDAVAPCLHAAVEMFPILVLVFLPFFS